MSIFSRISDIAQANLNTLLDSAEDPHKVVRLIVQEMEETLVELRAVAAKHLAEQKTLERQIQHKSDEANLWLHKAEVALQNDKEALARAALQHKQQCLAEIETMQTQLASIDDNLQKLQADAARLQSKLAEVKQTERNLAKRAEVVQRVSKPLQTGYQYNVETMLARYDRYAHKVAQSEASSNWSLRREFADLMSQAGLDAELDKLKAKRHPHSQPHS
jgi:phage shock protein A